MLSCCVCFRCHIIDLTLFRCCFVPTLVSFCAITCFPVKYNLYLVSAVGFCRRFLRSRLASSWLDNSIFLLGIFQLVYFTTLNFRRWISMLYWRIFEFLGRQHFKTERPPSKTKNLTQSQQRCQQPDSGKVLVSVCARACVPAPLIPTVWFNLLVWLLYPMPRATWTEHYGLFHSY